MKRRRTACTAVMCAVALMTGCGSAIPDMTENETRIVAEYAANLLLKYDKNYEVKVVDTTAYHKEEERKAEEILKAEEAQKEEAAKVNESAETENTKNDSKGETEKQQAASIEEFFEMQGVQIQYSGFEVYDSYPEQTNEEDLFFALNATDGRKLLVMFFDVKNISGQELEVSMTEKNSKFRVSVNGETAQNALLTFLPDDLTNYNGTLAADETVKTVVVIEIPTEESSSVESLELILKNETDKAQITLQ